MRVAIFAISFESVIISKIRWFFLNVFKKQEGNESVGRWLDVGDEHFNICLQCLR